MLQRMRLLLWDFLYKNRFFIAKNNTVQIANTTRHRMKKVKIKINGHDNRLIIGENVVLSHCEIRLRGKGNLIEISDKVKFNSGKIYLFNTSCQHIKIGKATTVEGAYLLIDEAASIDIGDDCMLSTDIIIRCGDKHSIIDCESGQRLNPSKDIKIHNRVWIGRDVQILKGSELLPETVIATRSVVTRAFSEGHCVIGGIPAAVIRRGIRWDRALL